MRKNIEDQIIELKNINKGLKIELSDIVFKIKRIFKLI